MDFILNVEGQLEIVTPITAFVAIIGDEGTSRVDLLGVTVKNSMAGVIVWDAEADLDGCEITGMKPNGGFGVMAAGAGIVIGIPGHPRSGPSNVKVKGSTVSENDVVGMYVCDGSVLEANFNSIVGNTQFGVANDGAESVDARHNWWGTAAGPFHPTLNPAGAGNNAVSDEVTFSPWTVSEVVTEVLTEDGIVYALTQADTKVRVKMKSSSVSFGYDANSSELADWQIFTLVAITDYPDNPADSNPAGFIPLHSWVDVFVSDPEVVEEVEIRLYYTEDAISDVPDILRQTLQLMWLDDNEWKQFLTQDRGVVSPSDRPGYSGYMWVKLTATTRPNLTYLEGGEFGGYGGPIEVDGICGGGLSSGLSVGLLCVFCCYRSLRHRHGKRRIHAAGGQ